MAADVDNANWWLGNNSLYRGLSAAENQRLANAGYTDPTRDFLESWRVSNKDAKGRPHPIQWGGEVPRAAQVQNEARYGEMLGINQLRSLTGNDWLDRAQSTMVGNDWTARGLLDEADRSYRAGSAGLAQNYRTALGEIESGMGGARRSVLDREQSNLGRVRGSLGARGLGNTTVLDNANRGVYSDTDRSLTDIADRGAAQRSGLAVQRAGAQYAADTGYGNFLANYGAQVHAMGKDQGGFLERRAAYDDTWLSDRQGIIRDRTDVGQAAAASGGGVKRDNSALWAAGIGSAAILAAALV